MFAERFRKQEDPPRLEPMPGRVPPSDLDAEAAVLSAILLDSEGNRVALHSPTA